MYNMNKIECHQNDQVNVKTEELQTVTMNQTNEEMCKFISEKYDVIEYIEGHYSSHSKEKKNPMWRVKEK